MYYLKEGVCSLSEENVHKIEGVCSLSEENVHKIVRNE
jgi:hypothetical protein